VEFDLIGALEFARLLDAERRLRVDAAVPDSSR